MKAKIWSLVIFIVVLATFQNAFSRDLLEIFGFAPATVKAEEETPKLPPVQAAKRGFPSISLADGVDAAENPAAAGGASGIALAAADFDSDGVADLVTADANGHLVFYRGNVDSIYPNTPEAARRRLDNAFNAAPFGPEAGTAVLDFAPDYLFAGDFNADGRADLLAASKNSATLVLLAGDGRGHFAARPQIIWLGGTLTALAAGEIGRPDGQTDVAAAIVDQKGARLFVFESPEGAFRQKPEIFALAAPAAALAVGELDGDGYADVAVAADRMLTLVHGRGQAFPFDRLLDSDIVRPAAIVEKRRLAAPAAALAVGRFGAGDTNSLAILSADGTLQTLQTVKTNKPELTPAQSAAVRRKARRTGYAPAGNTTEPFALAAPDEAAGEGLPVVDNSGLDRAALLKKIEENGAAAGFDPSKLGPDELNLLKTRAQQEAIGRRARSKASFEKSIAARLNLPLASWTLQTAAADARLANAAASSFKMIPARVSATGRDDLVIVDNAARQILIASPNVADKNAAPVLTALDAGTAPRAILPMRLNSDALSDLVILREGSPAPQAVMTVPASTLVVTTADDSGGINCDGTDPCSLRYAITLANGDPAVTRIEFNIGGGGPQTIHPLTPLPAVARAGVVLDATTQPGFAGTPLVEIKGDLLTGSADGLQIVGSNIVVRGFAVNQMPSVFADNTNSQQIGGSGIVLARRTGDNPAEFNIVEGNFLGLAPSGIHRKSNHATGLSIYDSSRNTIGGTAAAARNVMSGNGFPTEGKAGVGLAITAGNDNRIEGNLIGTDYTGTFRIGNSYGVFMTGKNNVFGGDEAGAGNTVSGNGETTGPDRCSGVGISEGLLFDVTGQTLLTLRNNYRGNNIGTDAEGAAPLGNCTTGIRVSNVTQPIVGSITEPGRNVISANDWDAIWAGGTFDNSYEPAGFMSIIGNNIGTDRTGNIALPNTGRNGCVGFCQLTDTVLVVPSNGAFVAVGSPAGLTEGGACTGMCNLISGNDNPSIDDGGILRAGNGLVLIVNNFIGLNKQGTAPLPNFGPAQVSAGDTYVGGVFSDDNGGFISGGNVISGNYNGPLGVGDAFTTNGLNAFTFVVQGNLIGTSSDGLNPVPNQTRPDDNVVGSAVGMSPAAFSTAIVGGTDPLARNVIAGNTANGIGTFTSGPTFIRNNYIGLNKAGQPLGNGRSGIFVRGSNATIGGTGANEGNYIQNNHLNGITVSASQTVPSGGNRILGNSIANNDWLGIDLTNSYDPATGSDGVTDNDCDDTDTGANGLQNFPEMVAPVNNPDGTVTVAGFLVSTASRTYTLQFYSNQTADASNHGEGETYLGSIEVRTDSDGFVTFNFTSPAAVSPSAKITATATDLLGSTSEFSCFAGGCLDGSLEAVIAGSTPPACPVNDIVVNVTSDLPDTDGDAPNALRDGHCDTDPDTPGDQCSLRAAIQEANARPGRDTVKFNIPGGGAQTIVLGDQPLPAITQGVVINGESQPGREPGGEPRIVVKTGFARTGFSGLKLVNVSSAEILELKFVDFDEAGIKITGGSGNIVRECVVGEVLQQPPTQHGILVENSTNNDIGSADDGNRLIDNANGITIRNSSNNRINRNLLKLNDNGIAIVNSSLTAIGEYGANQMDENVMTGIYISNVAPPTPANFRSFFRQTYGRIARDEAETETRLAKTETLVKERREGSSFDDEPYEFAPQTPAAASNNTIYASQDNVEGIQDIRGYGIYVGAAQNTLIGNGTPNLVVLKKTAGIYLSAQSSQTTISTAYVGTDTADADGLGNQNGIVVLSGGNTIRNSVVSGNVGVGIALGSESVAVSGNTLVRNFVGTDDAGFLTTPNLVGIYVNGTGNTIGSGQAADANVIGGNTGDGIQFANGAAANKVLKNYIGISPTNRQLANKNGILLRGLRNTIKANFIAGNTKAGIRVEGPPGALSGRRAASLATEDQNVIRENLIGTTVDGAAALANETGVLLTNGATDNLLIGNTISGNTTGVRLGAFEPGAGGASFNLVQKNRIGTNPDGTAAVANTDGIVVNEGGTHNTISAETSGNLISGNTHSGIYIGKLFDVGDPRQPLDNTVSGNLIGDSLSTDPDVVIPNGVGIRLGTGAQRTLVGGPIEIEGNTIVASVNDGISIVGEPILSDAFPTRENKIFGNFIGLKSNGGQSAVTGNGRYGIFIQNSDSNEIGSADGFERSLGNIIGLNHGDGVHIEGIDPEGTPRSQKRTKLNRIVRNDIGLNQNESAAGNLGFGVSIKNAVGTRVFENRIVNNGSAGILVDDLVIPRLRSTAKNAPPLLGQVPPDVITGNQIGFFKNAAGQSEPGPNGADGIRLVNTTDVLIGKENVFSEDRPNFIGGNNGAGIRLINAQATTIRDCFIGTDENNDLRFGNSSHGIYQTDGSSATIIGGTNFNSLNVIFHNGEAGVRIEDASSTGNFFGYNSIHRNSGLGIDLGEAGQDPNDPGDADEGVNRGQNYPEIANYAINGDGDLIVSYRVDTAPANADYGPNGLYVEFYKADPSGGGEAFLGSDYYTVNNHDSLLAGTKTINLGNAAALFFTATDKLTSIARDADNNTSEFTPVASTPTAARVTISGKVADKAGNPVSRAMISLIAADGSTRRVESNSLGIYRFENVEAGQTYVVSVAHRKIWFDEPSRLLQVDDAVENVDFTAREQ